MTQSDPANLAVALAYQEEEGAPRVVAKGRGLLAQAIVERAREAGVYVHESPELVALLMQVDLDQRIPPQLYVAVAELLAWLYRIERGEDLPPVAPLRGLHRNRRGAEAQRTHRERQRRMDRIDRITSNAIGGRFHGLGHHARFDRWLHDRSCP